MSIQILFMLFITYSVIGWLMETVFVSFSDKELQNRGFFIGPYIPIYGIGAILIIVLLTKYMDSPLVLFCMAIVICSLLEYFTSYIMEKLFNARWWDYSNNKFNINGRVCLETMLPFGLIAVFVMYYINPFFTYIYSNMSFNNLNILCIVLAVIFFSDFIISLFTVIGYTKNVKRIKFSDIDITKDINEYIKKTLFGKSFLFKRLFKAFPNADFRIKLRKKLKELTDSN